MSTTLTKDSGIAKSTFSRLLAEHGISSKASGPDTSQREGEPSDSQAGNSYLGRSPRESAELGHSTALPSVQGSEE